LPKSEPDWPSKILAAHRYIFSVNALSFKFSRFPGNFYRRYKIVMANEFYSPGEQRGAKVSELFARIAPRYDLINDVQSLGMHRLWKRRVVRLARVREGERALDLCCGTGDLAFALAKAGAEVVGLDFSEEMLGVARHKSKVEGPKSKVEFVRGDAQQIPFPENTFDVVTIGYGLRNLADLDAGIREMLRVSKPGGRMVALDFGKPGNVLLRGIYFGYLKMCLPLFGKIFCGNAAAYAYVLESLKHYPGQQGVSAKMREAGWENVKVVNLIGGAMSIQFGEKAQGSRAGGY
jgi:demethylmenaquinone methyltransferase / 2-methoxy-6-polyprenyl-1,4-benzoquinol methylase